MPNPHEAANVSRDNAAARPSPFSEGANRQAMDKTPDKSERSTDNSRVTDLASKPYEVPKSTQELQNAIKADRAATATTGNARTEQTKDNKPQAIESFDKRTGETMRYTPNKDGTWSQQKVEQNAQRAQELLEASKFQAHREQQQLNASQLKAPRDQQQLDASQLKAHREQQQLDPSQLKAHRELQAKDAAQNSRPDQSKDATKTNPKPEQTPSKEPAIREQVQSKDAPKNHQQLVADNNQLKANKEQPDPSQFKAHREQKQTEASELKAHREQPQKDGDTERGRKSKDDGGEPGRKDSGNKDSGNKDSGNKDLVSKDNGGKNPGDNLHKDNVVKDSGKPEPAKDGAQNGRPEPTKRERIESNLEATANVPKNPNNPRYEKPVTLQDTQKPAQPDQPRPEQGRRHDPQRWDRPENRPEAQQRPELQGQRWDKPEWNKPDRNDRPQSQTELRPQGFRPGVDDGRGPRAEWREQHREQFREWRQQQQQLQDGQKPNFQRPDRPGDFRPADGPRPGDHFRPGDQVHGPMGRLQDGPGKAIPGDVQRGLPGQDLGRGPHVDVARAIQLQQAMEAGRGFNIRDLNGGQLVLKGEVNLKAFMDGQRGDVHSQLAQHIRMMNADQFNAISRSLSAQNGDFGIRLLQHRPGMDIGDRTVLSGRQLDAMSLHGKEINQAGRQLSIDPAIRQITQLMDFLGRNHQIDRVPTADQSKAMIRELLHNPRLDQNANHLDANNALINRTLNQRNIESGIQNQTLTIKPQHLETMRELVNMVKNHDLLTKDPGRIQDTQRVVQDAKVTSQATVSNTVIRAAEAEHAATNRAQEQQRADREILNNRETQTAKNQPDLNTSRQFSPETKPDAAQTRRGGSDDTITSTSTTNDDKKTAKSDEIGKKEKDPELTQEQLATALADKLRALKEKELQEKEKEKKKEKDQEKGKKDPKQKTRLKYRIREKDNLSDLAARFLQDASLAPAIFHINRTVIPVITHNGNSFASLPANQMIWIPCDDDIEIYKDTGVGKQYSHIGFSGVEYASPEEELAARFGRRWFGPSDNEKAVSNQETRRSNIEKILGNFAPEENETPRRFTGDRAQRRANIEKILGPLSPAPSDGQIRYVVRLGETLKSIALKHPSLRNVEAWRLIASINGLSTETDAKGCPLAVLKRGSVLQMPTQEQIAAFEKERSSKTQTAIFKSPSFVNQALSHQA